MPTGAPEASRRGEGGLLTYLRNDHHAHKYLRGIPVWRRGLQDGLWHGDPTHRYLRDILACRNGLVSDLRHGDPTHRYFRAIPACRNGLVSDLRHSDPAHRCLSGIPAWQRTNTDRSSARPPCPQVLQGHPGVAKSHLTKDKPVSARCKDQLSYCRAYRQTCRMVSYVGLTDRQTGHPYRPPYRRVSSARLSDLQTARLTGWFHTSGLPTVRPACLTDSLT